MSVKVSTLAAQSMHVGISKDAHQWNDKFVINLLRGPDLIAKSFVVVFTTILLLLRNISSFIPAMIVVRSIVRPPFADSQTTYSPRTYVDILGT